MPDKREIARLQRALNDFTNKWLKGTAPLIVDGDKGTLTNRRILTCKYYLGWGKNRNSRFDGAFLKLLENPHRKDGWPAPQMRRTGMARRARYKAEHTIQMFRATVAPNVTMFDGRPCAVWIAKHLQTVRNAGRWKGHLNSGWRSPSYSRSLCIAICGAARCPGRCAGTSSNHSGSREPEGAADVSDYVTFGQECRRLGIPLHNALPNDLVHYSSRGN